MRDCYFCHRLISSLIEVCPYCKTAIGIGKRCRKYFKQKIVNQTTNKTIYIVKTFRDIYKSKSKDEIIKKLQLLAFQKFPQPIKYKKRRKKKWGKPLNKLCFACKVNEADYYHHIILIKNGGIPDISNTIPICKYCHGEIHPWLKKTVMGERKRNKPFIGDGFINRENNISNSLIKPAVLPILNN